ncbi:MAG: efflux RND transporter periplasmic adaptor subunit [Pirellulaceae bacterium]
MSTDSYSGSSGDIQETPAPGRRFTVGPNKGHEDTPPIDRKLIQETRDQIRTMVDEITRLSQSDCSPAEFYQGFLTRTTGALASVGGAVWSLKEGGGLNLEYQINFAQTGLVENEATQISHGRLLQQLAEAGEPELIQPASGETGTEAAGNPTQHLLVIGPLKVEQKVVGLVEIFQRSGAGPTTQRGYLRFLVQMCKAASDYLRNEQLRQYSTQKAMWHRMQSFVRSIHGSLNTRDTAYAIANEGRRLIDCDRVSVALKQGSRLHVQTMSGLDTIERRAEQIKKLSKLATIVTRAAEPMWYSGDDSHLPPQIEKHLHNYLDVSHSKLVVIEPLREIVRRRDDETKSDTREPQTGKVIGALIVEKLGDDRETRDLRQRIQTVTAHSNDALTNSISHTSMFLAPLWTWLGKTAAITSARNLPKTLLVAGTLSLIMAALWLVPYPFTLGANGKLVPENRSEVWSSIDGVLKEIRIPEDPDAIVNAGDVLAVMTNNDLMVEMRNLQGQLDKSGEEVNKLKRAQHAQMTPAEARMIGGELAEAETLRDSLARQLELKMSKAELLNVRAPVTGHIFNWQLRQNLLRRPVSRGQNLMTIVHPDTPWEIELEFPERRVSHLMTAFRESDEPLQVTFTLASHPGNEYTGKLVNIDNKLDVRSDDGNAVLVRVAFTADQFPGDLLRSGTRVTAQVHAGNRSLGYVWFHELIETVHSTWLLWF